MRDRGTIRGSIVAGSVIVVMSIVLALVLHRPKVECSFIGSVPPPGCVTSDYSMTLRIGIVLAGFMVALLILIGDWVWSHWKHK
jgi:hypothetical protein